MLSAYLQSRPALRDAVAKMHGVESFLEQYMHQPQRTMEAVCRVLGMDRAFDVVYPYIGRFDLFNANESGVLMMIEFASVFSSEEYAAICLNELKSPNEEEELMANMWMLCNILNSGLRKRRSCADDGIQPRQFRRVSYGSHPR
jgi:hypothetical protein